MTNEAKYGKLRVAGVPEHFNIPWEQAISSGVFLNKYGVDVEFIEEKLGTGALIKLLKNEEVDVIVALTEGLVADIANKSDIRLIATYVESPLCWAISTGTHQDNISSVSDLRGLRFGISRQGSGSQLMVFVLALQRNWNIVSDLSFVVNGSFQDLRNSLKQGTTEAFMWEKFMTKPFHDSGEIKKIGEITTPWPCFMIASRKTTLESRNDAINAMLDGIQDACHNFHIDPKITEMVCSKFGHRKEDAEKWYKGVHITGSRDISEAALATALDILRTVHVIEDKDMQPKDLCDLHFAHLRKDIKSMSLYHQPELIHYLYSELKEAGLEKGKIDYEKLIPYDQQHHYYGTAATDTCASLLQINEKTKVLQIGSGLGGPARYLAAKYGCKVVAVELQHDLHVTAKELTERTGMKDKVDHIVGDILQISDTFEDNSFDVIISWLTILHIPLRKVLFDKCNRILKQGGFFCAEDFYEKSTLTKEQRKILEEDVYCSFLPTMPRYKVDLEKSLFHLVSAEDLTEDWTKWTRQRSNQFHKDSSRHCRVIGQAAYEGLSVFYDKIAGLFETGNLGGVRIIATKS
eukprot:TRINITY_DN5418_c0_g1_i1.p1 TRINITY_DN5418_c0_g1~~TRINITY_DN5418_c0_g1_i1.p1  ORF type:complete len:577 (+),score=123.80 TRINITY_DN5418_c0_g1_i1:80-1810(+)